MKMKSPSGLTVVDVDSSKVEWMLTAGYRPVDEEPPAQVGEVEQPPEPVSEQIEDEE